MSSHQKSTSRLLKNDIVLLAMLVVVALILFPIVSHSKKPGIYALVELDGAEYTTLNLNVDATLTVATNHGTNTIVVHDGSVSVESADCPDKTCVRMGWLHSAAMPIVCLPHRLVIEFVDSDGGVDAIAE